MRVRAARASRLIPAAASSGPRTTARTMIGRGTVAALFELPTAAARAKGVSSGAGVLLWIIRSCFGRERDSSTRVGAFAFVPYDPTAASIARSMSPAAVV